MFPHSISISLKVCSKRTEQSYALEKRKNYLKLAVNRMQDCYGHLQSNTSQQLLSKPTNISIQCRWHKDDESLDESFNSTSWYSGNIMETVQRHVTNTASSAMEISVSDRCTVKFKCFMALNFSRNQATVTHW